MRHCQSPENLCYLEHMVLILFLGNVWPFLGIPSSEMDTIGKTYTAHPYHALSVHSHPSGNIMFLLELLKLANPSHYLNSNYITKNRICSLNIPLLQFEYLQYVIPFYKYQSDSCLPFNSCWYILLHQISNMWICNCIVAFSTTTTAVLGYLLVTNRPKSI